MPLQHPHFLSIRITELSLPLLLKYLILRYLINILLISITQFTLTIQSLLIHLPYRSQTITINLSITLLVVRPCKLWNLWNFSYFLCMCCLWAFSLASSTLLSFMHKLLDSFRSYWLQFDQLFLEKLHELLIFQILLQTLGRKLLSFRGSFEDSTDSLLIGIHEGYHRGEYGSNIPAWAPCFLVIMRESCTDRLINLKASVVGKKLDFGRREGVVFR